MIRQAIPEDVHEVMPLLLAAIGSIAYTLAGTEDEAEAHRVLSEFYGREGNRISYEHVLVFTREGHVIGMAIGYPGDGAELLDRPFAKRNALVHGADRSEPIVVEARDGEYYLDAIAVDENHQGQGIAKALFAAFEEKGREAGYSRMSLIVEEYNEEAYALYGKLGYTEDGTIAISGGNYRRMAKTIE